MNPLADENPFDSDHLSAEEKLRNVARCVLADTEVKRTFNGRGRCQTYAQSVDAIAQSARQLAEDVIAYLDQQPPQPTPCPS
jgi:hypothetical protein